MKNIPQHEIDNHNLLMKYRAMVRAGKLEEAIKMADEHYGKIKEKNNDNH